MACKYAVPIIKKQGEEDNINTASIIGVCQRPGSNASLSSNDNSRIYQGTCDRNRSAQNLGELYYPSGYG